MKKDTYVSRELCPVCELLQEQFYDKTGISFHLFFKETNQIYLCLSTVAGSCKIEVWMQWT